MEALGRPLSLFEAPAAPRDKRLIRLPLAVLEISVKARGGGGDVGADGGGVAGMAKGARLSDISSLSKMSYSLGSGEFGPDLIALMTGDEVVEKLLREGVEAGVTAKGMPLEVSRGGRNREGAGWEY